MVCMTLELNGFDCIQAESAHTAHSLIAENLPDLVLLDWMMPGISGLELARRLRRDKATRHIPIIMITAKDDEASKIEGLDSGADDYITKPFSTRELVARTKALLRRTAEVDSTEASMSYSGLSLDPGAHRVSADGEELSLGPTEYRLLKFFMSHPDRAYSREQLLDLVWGSDVYIDERTVDVHIRRLRKALEKQGYNKFIQTVHGTGYRFSPTSTA
jgi:two-component system phosphate regulon response regulator PhoB